MKPTRHLNQRFVAHLMGLIPAWTSSAPLAMDAFRSWWLTHSARLEALCVLLEDGREFVDAPAHMEIRKVAKGR